MSYAGLTEAQLAEQCRRVASLCDDVAEGGGTSSWMLAVLEQGGRLHDMLAYKLSKDCGGDAS
jgi:hypothetical protein